MYPVPNRPHETKVSGGVMSVKAQHETMMISQGDERIWLQDGGVYDESGNKLEPDEFPGWFLEEYKKLTLRMKAYHPIDSSQPAVQAAVAKARDERRQQLQAELDRLDQEAEEFPGPEDVKPRDERPADETDEEYLHSLTKAQLMEIVTDEEVEDATTNDTKQVIVDKITRARAAKK